MWGFITSSVFLQKEGAEYADYVCSMTAECVVVKVVTINI